MPSPVAVRRQLLLGGREFGPAQLAGLGPWFDASDGKTLFQDTSGTTPAVADASLVGLWTDKSGKGLSAVCPAAPDASTSPVRKLAIRQGNSVLRFNGGFITLLTASLASIFPSAGTVVVAYAPTASGYTVIDTNLAADGWWCFSSGAGYMSFLRSTRVATYPASMPTAGAALIAVTSNSSAYEVWKNGVSQGVQSAAYGAGTTWAIGNMSNGSRALVGDIFEITAYNRVLAASELARLFGYFNRRWAIY